MPHAPPLKKTIAPRRVYFFVFADLVVDFFVAVFLAAAFLATFFTAAFGAAAGAPPSGVVLTVASEVDAGAEGAASGVEVAGADFLVLPFLPSLTTRAFAARRPNSLRNSIARVAFSAFARMVQPLIPNNPLRSEMTLVNCLREFSKTCPTLYSVVMLQAMTRKR